VPWARWCGNGVAVATYLQAPLTDVFTPYRNNQQFRP
jgi:hypothetical protein